MYKAEPAEYLRGTGIDDIHIGNLSGLLNLVRLINTDGVYPEIAEVANRAEVGKCRVEVICDPEDVVIAEIYKVISEIDSSSGILKSMQGGPQV